MKENTEKQPAKESVTFRKYVAEPKKLQPAHTAAEDGLHVADTNVGLDILDILDALPFYVLLIDEHHYILQANNAVKAQLGLEPKDIIGKYCPKVIHDLDGPFYGCPLEEAVEKGQAVEREAFDERSGRWISSAIYPTKGMTRDGKRIYFHMVTDITDRKEAEERLRTSREQLRSLSAYLESVREEERKNMAREIHDELGQTLTALKIDLSWLTKRSSNEQELVLEKTKSMSKLVDTAIQTVQRISAELRPGILDDLGLAAALEWQVGEFEKLTEIKCEFPSKPRDIVLDQDRSTAIFRIFRETLTNVVRHANATKVKVGLKEESGKIVLRVRDNGKGIGEKQISDPKAFGIIGMRERVRPWRGEVKISGSPGKGTTVVVSIPLVNKEKLDAESINSR
jgi:PAS domain S-box-containing protein